MSTDSGTPATSLVLTKEESQRFQFQPISWSSDGRAIMNLPKSSRRYTQPVFPLATSDLPKG